MLMNKDTIKVYFTIPMFCEIDPIEILNQYLFDDVHNTSP
ncbi:conserved hypothetical protein [Xenorhabdus innexi]|uniref:Uncharacterized protein n=1 Tax=Xenorhabdus innexi TaxID=290109 RepID=A0A1N6MW95_9GAMM|nr:conserved hypothetical protein [Xenorhabdus innexi]